MNPLNAGIILQGRDPSQIAGNALANSAAEFQLNQARQQAPMRNALLQQQARGAELGVGQAEDQIIGQLLERVEANPDKDRAYRAALQIAQAKGIDVSQAPQEYDPQFVQVMRGLVAMPKDERTEFERLTAGLPEDQREQALMVRLGLAQRAGEGDRGTTAMREYELAQQQGFSGSFMDYQQQRGAGQGANAPSGYQFTENGELRFITGGPADPAVRQAQRGPGMSVTTPDGTQIQMGGNPQLGNRAQNELDIRELDARDQLARLDRIRVSASNPIIADMNTLEGNLKRWGLGWKDFISPESLTDEQAEYLSAVTIARGDILENLNYTIKQITGAAMTESEAARIGDTLPGVNDSPRQFQAKLNRAIEQVQASIARYNIWRSQGLGGRPEDVGSLVDIQQQMDQRFQDLREAVESGSMTAEEADALFASEFGL